MLRQALAAGFTRWLELQSMQTLMMTIQSKPMPTVL
jgi:hypothetical protein